jgi:hypothetical protein
MEAQIESDLKHFAMLIETLPASAPDTVKERKAEPQSSSRSELVAKLKAKLEASKKSRVKQPK